MHSRLLAAVEAVMNDEPADRAISAPDRLRARSARTVIVHLVLDQVVQRMDVKLAASHLPIIPPPEVPMAWSPRSRWRASVDRKLDQLLQEAGKILSAQDDVTAAAAAITSAVTTLGTVTTDLTAAVANITAEIAALKAANPAVDTTALNAAVAALAAPLAALQSADTAVDALKTS